MKPQIIGGDWLDPTGIMDFPDPMDLIMAVDIEPTRKEVRWEKGVKHVFLNFFEPRKVRISNSYLYQYKHKFDLIITHDPEVLERCSQAVFMPFGDCWILPEDRERVKKLENKNFSVSMICGAKDYMPGHQVRHEIWKRQEEIKMPRRFYQSALSKPPGFNDNPKMSSTRWDKVIAFDSMFHFAIENCRDNNYFTEKLIDCFATRTIPIYYGCPEICRWFNTKGMLIANSANEAINVVKYLTEDTYLSMLPHAIKNEELAKEFTRPMAERVQEIIKRNMYAN